MRDGRPQKNDQICWTGTGCCADSQARSCARVQPESSNLTPTAKQPRVPEFVVVGLVGARRALTRALWPGAGASRAGAAGACGMTPPSTTFAMTPSRRASSGHEGVNRCFSALSLMMCLSLELWVFTVLRDSHDCEVW